MCTLSWWRRSGALSLRFNRDELRGRPPAAPPQEIDGLIYPRDPQGGGTWICLGEGGTVHCLLNYYDARPLNAPTNPRSRGELPLRAAAEPVRPLGAWLSPEHYPPFHLLRLPLEGRIEHVIWDGESLQTGPAHPEFSVWTTSGWNSAAVIRFREELFHHRLRSCGLAEQVLEEFHFTRHAADPSMGPCMSRPEARTVSVTEIRVTAAEKVIRYLPLDDAGFGEESVWQERKPVTVP